MAEPVGGIVPEEQEQRREIKVREAGPFLQLMNLRLSEDDHKNIHRVLPNREVMKKISGVCDLIHLLQDPILPSLRVVPTDATQLLMMEGCAHNLKEYGRAVGGSFNVFCEEFAQRMNAYITDARGYPGVSLRGKIDDLMFEASRFLDITYTADEAEGCGSD